MTKQIENPIIILFKKGDTTMTFEQWFATYSESLEALHKNYHGALKDAWDASRSELLKHILAMLLLEQ
jgi:hypothetical protein